MSDYNRNYRDNKDFRDFRDREPRERESRTPSHVRITVNKDESIEKAIRKFKKLCEKAGIKKEIKARRYYEKPSEARRREERKNERNRRKAEKKTSDQRKYQKPKFKNDDNS